MNDKSNATYQFFVKKGLIKQRGQIFPIFSYRLSNNDQKYSEINVSPTKVIHSSVNHSLLTIPPRKNTAYQYYIESMFKKRAKQKQNPQKLQTQSIDSIQGRKVQVLKEAILPKLTLRRQPQKIKHIKQELCTEPVIDLQPWEGSQQSFVMF